MSALLPFIKTHVAFLLGGVLSIAAKVAWDHYIGWKRDRLRFLERSILEDLQEETASIATGERTPWDVHLTDCGRRILRFERLDISQCEQSRLSHRLDSRLSQYNQIVDKLNRYETEKLENEQWEQVWNRASGEYAILRRCPRELLLTESRTELYEEIRDRLQDAIDYGDEIPRTLAIDSKCGPPRDEQHHVPAWADVRAEPDKFKQNCKLLNKQRRCLVELRHVAREISDRAATNHDHPCFFQYLVSHTRLGLYAVHVPRRVFRRERSSSEVAS